MAKPEWGAKRICHNCGARYYDLQRDPIVCPKCGTEYDPEAFLKSRRSRSAIIDEPPVKARAVVADEDADPLLDEEAEEEEAAEEVVEEVEVIDAGDLDETLVDEDGVVAPKEKAPVEDEFEEDPDLAEEEEDALIEDVDDLGEEDVDVEIEDDGEERNR